MSLKAPSNVRAVSTRMLVFRAATGVYARSQFSNESEVAAHVRVHGSARMYIRFEVRVTGKTDVANGLHDGWKWNRAFAHIVRVVFKVKLADAVFAQPADLLHHVEPGLRGVADIVVDQDVFGEGDRQS